MSHVMGCPNCGSADLAADYSVIVRHDVTVMRGNDSTEVFFGEKWQSIDGGEGPIQGFSCRACGWFSASADVEKELKDVYPHARQSA